MSIPERAFPPHCPNCRRLNAVLAQPHCTSPSCPWLRCTCGAVFTEAGSFQIMTGGAQ